VPKLRVREVEMALEKLRSHKSPELIKAEGRTIFFGIHKLTNSTWNKEELPEEWKDSIVIPVYKKGDKIDCRNHITFVSYIQNCI